MKVYSLIFLVLMSLSSCSSSDSPEDPTPNNNTSKTYQGDFVSVAHPTSGLATINSDKTILKVANFKTDNGPVLEMYLATDTSVTTYISLGVLKGLDGTYEYTLPANVNFDVYKYVIVWCVDFKVNFGHAILTKQ